MHVCGMYRAIVSNNLDPENRGRLRLRIPVLYGNLDSGWAYPVPLSFTEVPAIGDVVWAAFEQGDVDRPVYFGR